MIRGTLTERMEAWINKIGIDYPLKLLQNFLGKARNNPESEEQSASNENCIIPKATYCKLL